MVQLDSVAKSFGGRTLFEDLSFRLRPGSRIGLVGPNGTGKTTLFRILSGELEPDAGRIVIPTGASIGLLPQSVGEMQGGTVWTRMLEARQDLLDMEAQLLELRDRVSLCEDLDELERLSARLGTLEDAFTAGGGYELHARAKSILNGMGFGDDRLESPVEVLSGGWRMRLVLAQLLLQRPTVLLMDEPTNHLDVPSLEWLEGFLGGYDGTVVIISHDRYFLNRLVDEIASLENGRLYVEPGNFDDYLEARAQRLLQAAHSKEMQDKEIARLSAFVERFRYKASKARQAQSRAKQLDKLKDQRVELQQDRKNIHIRFPDSPRSGREVVRMEGVDKAFGEQVIYQNLDFSIERGERIALVGPNGEGKSTLLKMIAAALSPDAGKVVLGHQVVPGYFAQHHIEGLDLDISILRSMERAASAESFPRCRSILGAFLFSGDDVEKKIRVLSGGEKHRVALAQLMLAPSNLLLLDEPTNHLDMESRAVLEQALDVYEGTVVFVSHDRTFINNVATRVVHVANRQLRSYEGGYDEFAQKRAEEVQAEQEALAAAAGPSTAGSISRKDARKAAAERRSDLNKRMGSLKKEVAALEKSIETLEAQKEAVSAKLADADFYSKGDPKEVADATKRFAKLEADLADAYAKWEEGAERIAEIEAEYDADA